MLPLQLFAGCDTTKGGCSRFNARNKAVVNLRGEPVFRSMPHMITILTKCAWCLEAWS